MRTVSHVTGRLGLACLIAACSIPLTLPQRAHSQSFGGELRTFRTAFPIGALRTSSPADAKVAAAVLLKRIVYRQGYDRYSTDVPENREEFIAGLKAESYDFVLIESLDFIAMEEEFNLVPRLAGSSNDSDPRETLILLTTVEGANKGWQGLRDKRLLMERAGLRLSRLWLEVLMAEEGYDDPDAHFNSIETVANCSQAVLPVFFGKADACIVSRSAFNTMAELNPQISRRLVEAHASEPLLISLMCLREDFVERIPGQLDRVSTSLHESPDGQQILNMMRVERLLLWEPQLIETVERLAARKKRVAGNVEKKALPTDGALLPDFRDSGILPISPVRESAFSGGQADRAITPSSQPADASAGGGGAGM